MQLLIDKFGKQSNEEPSVIEPSPILARIQQAIDANLPYELIISMPYHDMYAMLIELWIKKLQEYAKRLEEERLGQRNVERRQASKADYLSLLK